MGAYAQSPAVAAPSRAAEVQSSDLDDAIRIFQSWMQSQISYQGWPGVSVGIVHDQELVWAKGFGYSDVQKHTAATPDTIYRIGSITKLFTACAILQLRDRGLLQLDDPVTKYLPWFHPKERKKDAAPITIRHLLTHTSGLPKDLPFPYWTDSKFPSREQMREVLKDEEIVFPPETKLKYSNLGFSLLGEVIASVSGQSYEEYIQKQILKPLGMEHTSVFIPEDQRKILATGYGRRMPEGAREIRPFENLQSIAPAGNISSCVRDLARFVSAQFLETQTGAQILKPSTWRAMYRPQELRQDWRSGFGLGFSIRNAGPEIFVGHEGWVSGYRTRVRMNPKNKFAVIVLGNADDVDTFMIADQAFGLFEPILERRGTPAAKAAPSSDPQWSKYVGTYRSPWEDFQVMLLEGELVMFHPNDSSIENSLMHLHSEGEHRFRIVGGTEDMDGELLTFEFNKDGAVEKMNVGATYVYRVP